MFKGEIKIHHKIFRKIEKEETHSKRSILPWCQKQTRECVQSCFSHVWLSATLWTIACQASLSMDSPGFPGGSDGKSVCQQCGRPGIDPWEGKIPREGNGNPLQYSCLDNPTDVRSLVGYRPWGRKESDTTEWLHFSRQEYWGELSCPPPGDLSNPGIEPTSLMTSCVDRKWEMIHRLDQRDGSPPGSPVPGILQARTLEGVALSFSSAWKWEVRVKSLSRVRLFTTQWTAADQAPPSALLLGCHRLLTSSVFLKG